VVGAGTSDVTTLYHRQHDMFNQQLLRPTLVEPPEQVATPGAQLVNVDTIVVKAVLVLMLVGMTVVVELIVTVTKVGTAVRMVVGW
jgi:hypothetical protein